MDSTRHVKCTVTHKCTGGDLKYTHKHTQPFYGSVDFVGDNLGEAVPEETFTPNSNPERSHDNKVVLDSSITRRRHYSSKPMHKNSTRVFSALIQLTEVTLDQHQTAGVKYIAFLLPSQSADQKRIVSGEIPPLA